MPRPRYELLPQTDYVPPAIEVNLTAVGGQNLPQQQQSAFLQEVTVSSTERPSFILNGQQDSNTSSTQQQQQQQQQQTVNDQGLAPFELPSYNEALKLKKLEAGEVPPSYFSSVLGEDTRIVVDPHHHPVDLRALYEAHESAFLTDQEIGSECMFLSAFMIAFFFNWVGFFAGICLLPNAAGKYGALSGFGLSMAKWVTIVRYQDWMTNMNDFQQKLFFWVFIFLGFYLFFRGLINYMTLKYRPVSDIESRRAAERWLGIVE